MKPPAAISGSAQANEQAAAAALDGGLEQQIDGAQQRFVASASRAASALDGMPIAIAMVTVVIALSTLLGVQPRIDEYR